jgi:hypothetical protein
MEGGLQATTLAALGASPPEVAELLAYNENRFDLEALAAGTALPLPDEPFVAAWEGYTAAARERGAFAVLRERLPQLAFPIREGMGDSSSYRSATRQGMSPADLPGATGLALTRPDRLEIELHASPAGRIPVLIARERADFVALVQAFTCRNEPRPVPASQGALMVSGYNNWDRLHALRRAWEAAGPDGRETATWSAELARIKPRRDLYQDRFILLSDGPYSAVPAAAMGLPDAAWREVSLAIRREHECAHYFTRRLFGSMRNNLLDELIADYAGISAAAGAFRADWFLRFLGLEDGGRRPGGRLEIYRGDPPLSDGAFAVLARVVREAAVNLERFDARRAPRGLAQRARALAALASLRLEDLASAEGQGLLEGAYEGLGERLAWGA